MGLLLPKIVYPSGGANTLHLHRQPMRFGQRRKHGARTDTVSTAGKQQSVWERIEDHLLLEMEFVGVGENLLAPSEEFENAAWTKDADLVIGKNYLKRSEEFDHADWVKSGTPSSPVVTANATTAPDGTTTAEQIDFPATGVGEQNQIEQNAFSAVPDATAQDFIFSIWLRADSALSIEIQIGDNVGLTTRTVSLTTSWQRLGVKRTTDASASTLIARMRQLASQAAKTVYAWGAQLEYGPGQDSFSDYTQTVAASTELLVADPFWLQAPAGSPGASDGLNSKLPKRARQVVRLASTSFQLHQSVASEPAKLGALALSCYLKRQNATPPTVDLRLQDANTEEDFLSGAQTPGASWARFSHTATFSKANRAATLNALFRPNAVGTFYLFGAQLGRGSLGEYERTGTKAPAMDAWADFMGEALKGSGFDWYPDGVDASKEGTYKLITTDWDPSWQHNVLQGARYSFRLLARKEA